MASANEMSRHPIILVGEKLLVERIKSLMMVMSLKILLTQILQINLYSLLKRVKQHPVPII